jgi:hypothetical protein
MLARSGNIDTLLQWFAHGLASPLDVDNLGWSLIEVGDVSELALRYVREPMGLTSSSAHVVLGTS